VHGAAAAAAGNGHVGWQRQGWQRLAKPSAGELYKGRLLGFYQAGCWYAAAAAVAGA
jgi:hypothetical protein